MNTVIAICLVYMLAIFTIAVVQLAKATRKERLKRIKNFKRGQFALIYLAVIPLYLIAHLHNGLSGDEAFWRSLQNAVEIVILKYDYSSAAPLMAANLFYKITLELAFTLVALNALMFTVSLCGQRFLNFVSLLATRLFRKKVIVVVGHNPNSVDILKSVTKEHGKAILVGTMSPELRDDAFLNHADYAGLSQDDDLGKKILRLFGNFENKKVSVILNLEDDAVSLRCVKQLWTMMEQKKLTDLPLTEPCGLQVYAFADKGNESAFVHYEESSYGLIKFINRHEQIAMDFIETHPLTEYMTDAQLDYDTATVKPNVNLNVFMIGFGNLNETLFLTSVSNNQFLTLQDGKLQPKAVNYHLYDKNYPDGKIAKENTSVHSRSLNHGYMRYAAFLKENASKKAGYLALIEEPAAVQFHPCDISHPDFYAGLKATLKDKNAYSYVIVSFGTDMENIELAEKLQQKFHEWKVPSFVKIFVKVRDKKLVEEIKDDFTGDLIQLFGSNRDVVYNASKILQEEMTGMAKHRHLVYMAEDLKKDNKSPEDGELQRLAREKWYFKYKQCQRESNVFACLSIRMKLQLLGYDYAKEGNDVSTEFEAKYELNDRRTPTIRNIDDKSIWRYSNAEQTRNSIRHTYAVQEHQRWCANMICNGVVPLKKKLLAENNGRILEERLHGALTTMDGLIDYRNILAEARGVSAEQTDLIRYDYQLMDDVVWLLHKYGYRLIKK